MCTIKLATYESMLYSLFNVLSLILFKLILAKIESGPFSLAQSFVGVILEVKLPFRSMKYCLQETQKSLGVI